MAVSHHPTVLFPSTQFLESAGCILFDTRDQDQPRIILIHNKPRFSILLPKGRLNAGESRKEAAIRETFEETGLRCSLLPTVLKSRATSSQTGLDRVNAEGYTVDEVRVHQNNTDPFMCMTRFVRKASTAHPDGSDNDSTTAQLHNQTGEILKLIWWFLAIVDPDQQGLEGTRELDPGCEILRVPLNEAPDYCTFKDDRDIVERAIKIFCQGEA